MLKSKAEQTLEYYTGNVCYVWGSDPGYTIWIFCRRLLIKLDAHHAICERG